MACFNAAGGVLRVLGVLLGFGERFSVLRSVAFVLGASKNHSKPQTRTIFLSPERQLIVRLILNVAITPKEAIRLAKNISLFCPWASLENFKAGN